MTTTRSLHPLPGLRIAFVQSRWHQEIVDQCRHSFTAHLARLTDDAATIDVFEVPGAFELPLHAKLLAQSRRYQAVVCAGLVVDGGLYRHEFVAQAVISGLMQVQLETQVPVLSAVLTPHHFHEHAVHQQFFHQHFLVKGEEAAQAVVGTLDSLQRLDRPTPAPLRSATAAAASGPLTPVTVALASVPAPSSAAVTATGAAARRTHGPVLAG